MHGLRHTTHEHGRQAFTGRSSRTYDFFARRVLRRMYRRFAADIASVAPHGAAVLDVGTGRASFWSSSPHVGRTYA